jgi:tRNA dimethylallyltransferase
MGQSKSLIILCGPTGIGKTRVAIELANKLDCEIISADSRQLFKEMSIGTAVPSEEELNSIPHHFIHSHSIHQLYNASIFEAEVMQFLEEYFKQKNRIVMVGGSGLYIDAVCKGIDDLPTTDPTVREKWAELYKLNGIAFLQKKLQEIDPDYLQQADVNNPKRLLKAIEVYEMTGKPYSSLLKHEYKIRPFEILKIGLDKERKKLYDQINQRVEKMIASGLVEEAQTLYSYRNLTPLNTVGYKELFAHFDGTLKLEEAIEQIKNHTRAYARRQLTWFRRDKEIRWFIPENIDEMMQYIEDRILPY